MINILTKYVFRIRSYAILEVGSFIYLEYLNIMPKKCHDVALDSSKLHVDPILFPLPFLLYMVTSPFYWKTGIRPKTNLSLQYVYQSSFSTELDSF